MILITLGTQDKNFKRILDLVQKEIDDGVIKEEVYVQAGHTKYESNDMKIFDLLDREQFQNLIKKCDLLITHGGVGSIITGLVNNKKIIVCPRLAKYNEHINNHQNQITENFAKKGYIIPLYDGDSLKSAIKKSKNFIPNKFESNTVNFTKIIEDYIDNN